VSRFKQIAVFIFIVALAVVLGACTHTNGSGGKATAVAATVNGREISLSEVDSILNQQAKSQGTDTAQMSPLELSAGRLQVLDGLIKQEVLFQRAEKENLLPKDEEVTQKLAELKQSSGMTEEQYQQRLRETGQTEQELRDTTRKQLAINNLLDRVGSKVGTPSDKEVADFYTNNRDYYVNGRGVGLAAIIVDPADNGLGAGDVKGDAEAKNKIDIIYQQLKNGADFATVAREKSEDPQSAQSGGEIGFASEDDLKKNGFPPDLIAKFFGPMQVGDITPPFKDSKGRWDIFKLTTKHLQVENLTLENAEVRKDITDRINNQRKQLMQTALVEVAMNEAKVENKLAQDMMNNPDSLSSLRPAGAPTPATGPSPTGSSASPSPSPAASASPAATTKPTPRATNSPTVKPPATPAPKPPTQGNSNK
jgi:peptidyl-prolyl cis-trans isomerase SurA